MPGYQMGETVTLIRRSVTSRDSYGNDQYGNAETPWPNTVFDPGGSVEQLNSRDQVTTTASFIWVNDIPDLTAVDAIRRPNGVVYELSGEVNDFPSPFSGTRTVVAKTKSDTG